MDLQRIHPGCTLEGVTSNGELPGPGERLLVRFSYRCPGIEPRLYGALVYEKAMNTGFSSYCCAREAVADDYR